MAYRHLRFMFTMGLKAAWPHLDLYRVESDRWRRSWQCEWDGCQTARRGYTWVGCYLSACRAVQRSYRR